jgi:hypothetical protein
MSADVKTNSAGQIITKDIATVFNQAQVAYNTLSTTPNQACANCIFFRDTGYDGIEYQHCSIVEAYPDPILPTGICNHWEAKPEPEAEMVEQITDAVSNAVVNAVETISANVVVEMEHKSKTLLQRAKEALFPAKEDSAFNVFKGNDGKWYWIAKYTNAYQDKEGEIFTEKAHEEYIQRMDMGLVDKPELWVWHTKGTKHGKADTVFGVGRIMVAFGHFDDTPEAQKAIKYYQKNADKIKLSHGAIAPKWAIHDGLIESYNTFEISTLPNGAESNPYTSYEVIKAMQPDPKKVDMVAQVLGKEAADKLITGTAEYSKSLDDMLVRYKDNAQVGDNPAPTNTEAQTNMGTVFIEMVKEQGDIVKLLMGMEKRQNQTDELVKSLTKEANDAKAEVVELRRMMNAPLRKPSDDPSTELTPEAVKLAKEKMNAYDKDESAFWGAAVKGGTQ